MTLALIIFDKAKEFVLVTRNKDNQFDFIKDEAKDLEDSKFGSYRVFEEKFKMSKQDISLKFVREEGYSLSMVSHKDSCVGNIYYSVGVVEDRIPFENIDGDYTWISVYDLKTLVMESAGYGELYKLVRESFDVLEIDYDTGRIWEW